MQSAVPGGFSGGSAGSGGTAATAPPTPTGTPRQLQSTGQTPAAKRPATLTAMTGSADPVMTAADAKAFM